jgi:hypothetical protein
MRSHAGRSEESVAVAAKTLADEAESNNAEAMVRETNRLIQVRSLRQNASDHKVHLRW